MSTTTIGTIQLLAKIDTANYKKGAAEIDQANKKMEKSSGEVDKSLEKTGGNLRGMAARGLKVATAAFAAAATTATVFAVKSAAGFEQTRIGLENMLGSADKARKVLKEVSVFAAETPFEFPELANAVKQLVAFGFTGDDAVKTMKQLGDVSAAVGTPMGDLAYLMGTLKTQGRAFTIDIRQFAQRGIPIYEYLAKVLKTNEKELTGLIEAGKVGFPEVQKAFELMTAKGGKFNGAMAAQSKTLSGLFSTLKDNIGQTARELVGITQEGDIKKGSLFDRLRVGAGWLIDNLPRGIATAKAAINSMLPTLQQWASNVSKVAQQVGDYLGPKLEALWNTVTTKIMPMLLDLWHNVIAPLVPVLGTVLVVAIGLLIDQINLWYNAISWVYKALKDNNPFIWMAVAAVTALGAAFGITKAVTAATAAINLFSTSTIPLAIARMSALRLLLLTPMVMPAIAVAAAIASIWSVYAAAQQTKAAIDNLGNAARSASDSNNQAMRELQALIKNGTPEQKARALKAVQGLSAAGFASGGFTGRGASDEIAGLVHRGEYVLPKSMVDQSTGQPKAMAAGSSVNVTINLSGVMTDSTAGIREVGKKLIRAVNDELVAKGRQPIAGGAV